MIDERELLEKELGRFTPEPGMVERVARRSARKRRRQRATAGALGIAIATAVAVLAGTILRGSNENSGKPTPTPLDARTIYELDPVAGSVRTLFSSSERVANAERSLTSDQLVYERSDADGPSQIFVLERDGTERRLTDIPDGAFEPTWSPDGTQIAFAARTTPDEDTDIFVMAADGSRIRRLVGTPGPDGSPDWSPDGTRIVFHTRPAKTSGVRNSGRMWVATIGTRTLAPLAHPRYSYAQFDPVWSPDGRWIAFASVDAVVNNRVIQTTLRIIRPDGTQERRVVGWGRQIENPSWSPDGRFIAMEVNDPAWSGISWDFTTGRGDIAIVDVRTGGVRWVQREPPFDPTLDGSDSAFDQPSWGPEGILITLSPHLEGVPSLGGESNEGVLLGSVGTIHITDDGCQLSRAAPDWAELNQAYMTVANDAHVEARVQIGRLADGATFRDLAAWVQDTYGSGREQRIGVPPELLLPTADGGRPVPGTPLRLMPGQNVDWSTRITSDQTLAAICYVGPPDGRVASATVVGPFHVSVNL
jgi:hypothetical protein